MKVGEVASKLEKSKRYLNETITKNKNDNCLQLCGHEALIEKNKK